MFNSKNEDYVRNQGDSGKASLQGFIVPALTVAQILVL